jgi:Ca2+-dependent lipid-binding protein
MEERELGGGFTTNSNLYITVYEAKDLNSSSLISDCDAFVILNFDGKTQQTLIKKSTNNPAWNENFKFPVRKKDLILRVEVFDHTIMGSKLIGYIPIPLNSFINQEKNTKWFDLHLDDSDGKNRQIKLKVQFTYSLKKYYLE